MTSAQRSLLLLIALASAAALAETAPVRRYALVVGANDGGPQRVKLRYAVSDAKAFARVLTQLGGVMPENQRVVVEPSAAQLRGALGEVAGWLEREKGRPGRSEMIVYYSGHSDEEGFLLRGERVGYDELRGWLGSLTTDVRIAVVDSCASGSLTRTKGGQRAPPFLLDQATQVRGHAYLTSSAENEVSQESDKLEASFFTHYLLSGLRGAADSSRDGRITLNEAYQFAFHETLARTERSMSGAQHPAYDIQLAGSGDLVLTDLRASGSRLVLGPDEHGRFSVRDAAGGLVIEVRKVQGRPMELGLEPASYRITREREREVAELQVQLQEGERQTLDSGRFSHVAREVTASRGDGVPQEEPPVTPAHFGLLPMGNFEKTPVVTRFSFGLIGDHVAGVRGVALATALHHTGESGLVGAQLSGAVNWVKRPAQGAQVAGAFNVAERDAAAAQVAGGFNWVGGAVKGAQVTGGFNWAQQRVRGAQLSGGFNWAGGGLDGWQTAGGVNVATGGSARGLQLAVLNYGEDVHGAQVGVVNIARDVKGSQIGIVNVSRRVEGFPLGINIVREGRFQVGATASELALGNLEVKLGTQRVHTLLLAGVQPNTAPFQWAYGMGLGVRFRPVAGLFLDLDGYAVNVRYRAEPDNTLVQSTRLLVGYQVAPRFAFFAGPSANLMWLGDADRLSLKLARQTRVDLFGRQRPFWGGLVAGFYL